MSHILYLSPNCRPFRLTTRTQSHLQPVIIFNAHIWLPSNKDLDTMIRLQHPYSLNKQSCFFSRKHLELLIYNAHSPGHTTLLPSLPITHLAGNRNPVIGTSSLPQTNVHACVPVPLLYLYVCSANTCPKSARQCPKDCTINPHQQDRHVRTHISAKNLN